MVEFEISVEIKADRERVWEELADLAHQVEWMEDAKAIRFIGSKTSGTGTILECDTKIWFLSTTDRLQISQWIDGSMLTVNHEGAVRGWGKFSLRVSGETTIVSWHENLSFPWHLGTVVGEQIARTILKPQFNQDLKALKAKCENEPHLNPLEYFAVQNQKVVTRKKAGRWTVSVGGIDNYSTGDSGFAARLAALRRWQSERE